ncbi:hypothetical protein MNBD_BACTEROID06-686 [hydrothermal vent metagenome]|uniref:Uncharacterized protein n=1 Tax=hydrothermal vent metagenome TaxID=652676 RepID=A0A3B0UFD4_9ZZZZ
MSKRKKESPKVHKDLEGFDIKIDKFGEIKGNLNIDKINAFLDRNLKDKKLKK